MSAWALLQGGFLVASLLPAAFFLRYRRQSRVHWAFSPIVILGFLWALGQYAENCILLYVQNETAYRCALAVTCAGLCGLGPGTVYLAWCYSGQFTRYQNRRLVVALFGIGLFFYVCILTNPLHHLYYLTFSMAGKRYGPLFYASTIFSYTCFGYAFFTIQHVRLDAERTTLLALLCFGLPVLANSLGMLFPNPAQDATPLCYFAMLLTTHWLVWQHQPTNLAPVAAKSVLDHLGYALIIHDAAGQTVYQNYEAQKPLADGRAYHTENTAAADGNRIIALIDMTEQEAALQALIEQKQALSNLQTTLAEQTQTLIRHAQSASQLAAEQRRVDIMSRLNQDIRALLEQLAAGTERALETPEPAQIERNIALTVLSIETVRRIINEFRGAMRHGL